tara:strand:+ start:420 stop:1097 length:678 start_codon:yes stop_codon:yes gene_type:complete
MKKGILSADIDEYYKWIEDNTDPYERNDYFYVNSVVDLFDQRGVNVLRVNNWVQRDDLYEIYDYIANEGGLRDIVLDGRYLNDHTYDEVVSNNMIMPLESFVKDKSIHFKSMEDDKVVGTLSWQRGYFEFYGNSKESAKIFFEDIRNVSEDIIQDKYIKRTDTFSEYVSQEERRDELVEELREQLFLDCDSFINDNKLEGMDEDIKNFVNKVAMKCFQTFNDIVK